MQTCRYLKGAATPMEIARWPSLWVNRAMAVAQFEAQAAANAAKGGLKWD